MESSSGGLATGLRGPHERGGGVWVGWPGETPRLSQDRRADLQKQLEGLHISPVFLSRSELKGYYEDFSNGAIWPVFHGLVEQLPLVVGGWETYQSVNQKFAEAVAKHYREGDFIWVHDYQLLLLPALLREMLPTARIGFFLHIPFPAPDIFSVLPGRRELLEGVLGADLLGFHADGYADNFLATVRSVLDVKSSGGKIEYQGRSIKVGTFPMGIDAAAWESLAKTARETGRVEELSRELNGRILLLGIDRLDYTKGVPRRIAAVSRLLESDPELRERIRFVQIVVPSRENVESYSRLLRQLTEMVGQINSTFGTAASLPIHLIHRAIPDSEVAALYAAAQVMLVTPLRDGMNLVAKEYVASRVGNDGALVLSQFAGAAEDLTEAVIVNPYNVPEMADHIRSAIAMNRAEQKTRMQALRKKVAARNVHSWAKSFLDALGSPSP